MDLKRSGRCLVGLCPFHSETTPSFTVWDDHYHCFGCGAHGDIFQWLMTTRRMSFREAVHCLAAGTLSKPSFRQRRSASRATRRSPRGSFDFARRCWAGGVSPRGTIVETYLASRGGLTIPIAAPIRFHPRCQRGGRDLPGGPEFWPAMLSLLTDPITGKPVGVNRTFLLPDGSGKAPTTIRGDTVLTPKSILRNWGVVRLAHDAEIGRALGIAEGIENALTSMQIIRWGPVWAAGTDGGVREFPLLPWIECITIFADADDSGVGLDAARSYAKRWSADGREARIQIPRAGTDWNEAVRLPSP